MRYPETLQKLIECFQRLPGVGPKNAERLAFFIVQKLSNEKAKEFSEAIINVKNKIKTCPICGLITENEICDVCIDSDREARLLIVESTKEVIAIEKTNQYKGRYHILDGLISPLNGVNPEDIRLNNLLERINKDNIQEVIIATSATIEGEITALYIKKLLEDTDILISRIGYGLPAGGDIEYANEITLIKALEGRKKM